MEISGPKPPPPARRRWKAVAVATLGVAVLVVVVAVTVPSLLCSSGGGSAGARGASEGLARLEKTLDVTNRSLDGCRKELGVLEGKALELEQALAKITRLEKENTELRTEVSRQQEQLEQEQSRREELQLQNQALHDQLQNMWSHQTSGNSNPNEFPKFLLILFIFFLGLFLRK